MRLFDTKIGTISYGQTLEDARYTDDVLQTIIAACQSTRRTAEEPVQARTWLRAELLGACTLLGLTPRAGTAIETLHAALVQARDAEGAECERILTGGGSKQEASLHSGRRGVLDTARYEIEQATEHLKRLESELAAWDARRKARQAL